jgi:hypothetical protein
MGSYLDVLDAGGVPVQDRVLSALGPRMVAVASQRSAGTHPHLTIPAQTAQLRAGPSGPVPWSPPSRRWCSTPT